MKIKNPLVALALAGTMSSIQDIINKKYKDNREVISEDELNQKRTKNELKRLRQANSLLKSKQSN